MLCKQCGNELKENEKFCGKCGTKRENLEEKKAGLLPQNKEELKKEIAMKGEMAKERVFKFWEVGKSWLLEKWEMGKDFYKRKQKQVIGVGVAVLLILFAISFTFGGRGKSPSSGGEEKVVMGEGQSEEGVEESLEGNPGGEMFSGEVDNEESTSYENGNGEEKEVEVGRSAMTDEERLEYDKKERSRRENEWEVNAAYERSFGKSMEEQNFGSSESSGSRGRRKTNRSGIEEIYSGDGGRLNNRNFPQRFTDLVDESAREENDGTLMMRFQFIAFGRDTGGYGAPYEPSGKDITPLAEEVKEYLKDWGVHPYEPIEEEKLIREHDGYLYPFYGVDPNGYTITVYAYFETLFDEQLLRILVWTEDGFEGGGE